jgi:hypothetical protein
MRRAIHESSFGSEYIIVVDDDVPLREYREAWRLAYSEVRWRGNERYLPEDFGIDRDAYTRGFRPGMISRGEATEVDRHAHRDGSHYVLDDGRRWVWIEDEHFRVRVLPKERRVEMSEKAAREMGIRGAIALQEILDLSRDLSPFRGR